MKKTEVVNLFGEPAVDPTPHGTVSGYKHWKCRCEECKKAYSADKKARRQKKKQGIRGDESWHGTVNGYDEFMCRCDDCKHAKNANNYTRAHRNKDNIIGDEDWHGTAHGYNQHLCRCEPCKDGEKVRRLVRKYALTSERAKALLKDPRCKICGTKDPAKVKAGRSGWCIDHDHSCCPGSKSCGKCVREVLCVTCNSLIGFAKDDPEVLKSAITYIELHAT